jgi:hypothetical protein
MMRHYTPPNANLTLAHCAIFTATLLVLGFWALTILEADLAAASTSPLAGLEATDAVRQIDEIDLSRKGLSATPREGKSTTLTAER